MTVSLKRIFNEIFGFQEPKVMLPILNDIPWTDQHRGELSKFMKTATGKALIAQMNMELYYSQAHACVPSAQDASERCAIAHGKQQFITMFNNLSVFEEKEPEYLMTDQDLNNILQQRINGFQPEEVEL